ncbi:prospero homeobox protein 1a isoform X1 [Xiphias gladius]|uniref:prospero homeobox protein 1a isoform X1 n=2 Tax=Xiphias gladius TaxID=8245 RepID=UPI001A981DB7|nr:prospero homeobox protein 1a isoform X1 [Xiphias gladius]XP_039981223.1 prospero homeobox protein 1a isoform X1 [Xiphias gladius]XP_039981224.1 prospero homeobox protein 1a isoform X1 [Xiphias gladius]XP_039981225.1 prospero homeobox protein 1a isoform X1 [Xiphias gladius]XP_039981227.1 prospero homeobox protein 1a isoform X1 [Xiphias gladius]
MPDHDSDSLLNRQTKRRRVDIGVKRTVGSTASSTAAATTATTDNIARAKAAIFSAMNSLSSHSHHGSDTDSMECSVVQPHGGPGVVTASDSESKSNVLRKLLKRANSYEDTMMPFPGTTIISQLLKNNMAKNGGGPERGERGDRGDRGESGFPGSGLSNASSDAPQEDACSNSSQDSTPQECLSPFGRPPGLATFDIERLNDEHLRAKRARVENIIRGMSHSPSVVVPAASRHERDHEMDGERDMELDCPPPQSQQQAPSSPRGGEVCSSSSSSRENKRKQRLPQQQQQSFTQLVCQRKEQKQEERRQLKLQLEDMQKQLRQLQEKFFQIYDSTDDSEHNDLHNDLHNDIGNMSEDSPARSDTGGDDRGGDDLRSDNEMSDLDPGHFLDRARALLQEQALLADGEKPRREGLGRTKGQGGPGSSMHAEGKQLAETLKQELNSAMTQVVDTVVKVFAKPPRPTPQQAFPPLSIPPERFPTAVNGDNPNFHTANQRLQCFGDVIIPNPLDSFASMPGMPGATNDQTEALPLVVRKTPSEHHHQSSAVGAHGGHHHPALHPSSLSASMGFSPPSFRHPFPLPLMGYPFQSPLGAPTGGYTGKDRSSPDSMDLSRETTSLRTKMASGHHLGHHHRSCSPAHPGSTAEGLSLSLIKSECSDLQDMADISPYSGSNIQEGLSPNHLKKAKLMFFYTRYPSSNMLKMFFSDVKFNRCITSQLIKWFSNFREFYYIQMEKFARQAINDGVTGAEELSVSRDCELFRALNMHYNKANDFEVPDRFLEVAEITLREFFNAIVAGKDVDPSWKKAIYKVICKLDSEVPEIFKSPNCLQELLHEF